MDAQADAPTATTTPVTGNEDAAITFGTSLGWTLADADGSEYISAYEIGAFPANWGVAFNSNPNVT